MKKVILSILGIAMMGMSSYGQDKKLSIGISEGIGIPIGNFGKKEFNDAKAVGWTNTSFSYDLSISYKLGKGKFGLTTLVRRQTNSVDTEAIADAYQKVNRTASYNAESEDWKINQFLVGGFGTKPISDDLSVDFRVLVGIVGANRPLSTVYGNDTSYVTEAGASSVSFAYVLGTGLKYRLGDKLDLLVNVDYLGARPEFDVKESSNIGFSGNSIFKQDIMSINLSAGIAIKL